MSESATPTPPAQDPDPRPWGAPPPGWGAPPAGWGTPPPGWEQQAGAWGPAPRRRPPWGMGDIAWGLLVYLGASTVVTVAAIVVRVALDASLLEAGADDPNQLVNGLGIGVVLASAIGGWIGLIGWPVVASYRKGARSLRDDFGLAIRLVDVAYGVATAAVVVAVSALLSYGWQQVTGTDLPSNDQLLGDGHLSVGAALATFLVISVGTPIAEELFFRGLAMRAIARRFGPWAGIVLSSILFGALHATTADTAAGLVVVPVVTGLYGLAFAWVATRTGRLGASMVAHGCVNGIALVGLLLAAR